MKTKVLLIITFLALVNIAEAQSNFGKRKFSRSLFSKTIKLKPSKAEKKEIALEQKVEETTRVTEPSVEMSRADTLPLVELAITQLTVKPVAFYTDESEKLETVKLKIREEEVPTEKRSAPKQEVREQISETNMDLPLLKPFRPKNQVGFSDNSQKVPRESKRDWDGFVDALIYIGLALLIVGLIAGYMILYGSFPILATILGVILVLIGLYALMALALNALFDGIFSIFDR